MCASIIILYDCSNVVSNGSWGSILLNILAILLIVWPWGYSQSACSSTTVAV